MTTVTRRPFRGVSAGAHVTKIDCKINKLDREGTEMGGSEIGPSGPKGRYREWCEVDFRPASPGWRIVRDGEEFPMAGWLIMELREMNAYGPVHPKDDPPDGRPRKIVAAVVDAAGIVCDATDRELWLHPLGGVLGPGEEQRA